MKKNFILTLFFGISLFISNAQIETPKASPTCEISQMVGTSKISITYSRPGVKNRVVFGELVPYNKIWRTGANKATKISFSKDVKIGGKDLAAGDYSLFTIPSQKEWTIIFNKNLELWGTGEYNQDMDALRITVPSFCSEMKEEVYKESNQDIKEGAIKKGVEPEVVEESNHVESFTMDFGSFTSAGAELILSWEKTKVSIPIYTNAIEEVQKEYTALLEAGPDANTYYKGARFFLENNLDIELALKWIDLAIEKRPEAFWMSYHKAKILIQLDRDKEAIKIAEKVIEMSRSAENSYGYDEKAEKLIGALK